MQGIQKKDPISIHCILAMIYFVAVPLTITVSSSGGSFLKILALPIGLFFLITLFFYKDSLELNSVHAFFALYIISVIGTLFADGSSESISFVFGHIQNAGLMFCITLRKYNKREIEWLENIQIVLLGIMIWIGLFGGATYENTDRTTMEIFGSASDPNYFCGFYIFPIAVCLKHIAENKYRWLCLPLVLLGIYCVIMSGSRGGLLAIGVTLIVFVIMYARNVKTAVFQFFVLSFLALVFWIIILPYLPENIKERMSIQAVVESRGTYRMDIWVAMLKEIKNSTWQLFFGRGINAQYDIIVAGKMQTVVAHNNFIQTLYNQGIIGFLLFAGLTASAVIRNIRERKYMVVGMAGMIALTMSLTLNPNIKPFWNLIMYAGLSFTDDLILSKGVGAKDESERYQSEGNGKELAER